MKKLSLLFIIMLLFTTKVSAIQENTKINLNEEEITINGEKISEDINQAVYISHKMDNGGTSKEAIEANIEIKNIININKPGTYEFCGTLEDAQIAINANKVKGKVKIILNNANINCKVAPAIFIYSQNIENNNLEVTISTTENSNNTINGTRLKTDIKEWSDKTELYYSMDKGYDEKGRPYERYKYNGAISSDIPLIFEGEGTLNVINLKKEGIECKGNITFNGGNYIVAANDDAINAAGDRERLIEINSGTIIANVLETAEEGDGIDCNGKIIINGGEVYAFSYKSMENGFDSDDNGIYINGGSVFSIGCAYEEVSTENNKKIIKEKFLEEIEKGKTIVVVDENENAIFAFKTDRTITNFVYSSTSLRYNTYKIYKETEIPDTLKYSLLDLSVINKTESKEIEFNDLKYIDKIGIEKEIQEEKEAEENKFNRTAIIISSVTIIILIISITLKLFFSYRKKWVIK